MDPSYNNSFGSQAPIVSGPISSGAISSGSAGAPAGTFGSTPLSSGTGDIILGSGKQAKSKKPIIVAVISVVVMLIIALMALIIINSSKENDKINNRNAINNYIEYFVYGTEGENIVDDTIFEIPTDEYAASYINDEYDEKLIKKLDAIKIKDTNTKKRQSELLKFYIVATETVDGRNNTYQNDFASDDNLIASLYLTLNRYIGDNSDVNHKALRSQRGMAYNILTEYLNILYHGSIK
jgi:hypothetical protein